MADAVEEARCDLPKALRRDDAPIGGGSANDGVFANVVAKPTSARVERTPDGVHVMPEESQKDAPPVSISLYSQLGC